MTRIRKVSPDDDLLIAEAGVVLKRVQQAADEAGRLFPLSLGAEGSCTIGGNVSTNAGGVNVLRYGMMRELVLGLEVVLADGRVLDLLRGLKKDNTGYDLKQLFIGAEGTLGIVTAATLKLFPKPHSYATALAAISERSGGGRFVAPAAARDRRAGDGVRADASPFARPGREAYPGHRQPAAPSRWMDRPDRGVEPDRVRCDRGDAADARGGDGGTARCWMRRSPRPSAIARRCGNCARRSPMRTGSMARRSPTTSPCSRHASRNFSTRRMPPSARCSRARSPIRSVMSATAICTTRSRRPAIRRSAASRARALEHAVHERDRKARRLDLRRAWSRARQERRYRALQERGRNRIDARAQAHARSEEHPQSGKAAAVTATASARPASAMLKTSVWFGGMTPPAPCAP